jgi:hypothetical protein
MQDTVLNLQAQDAKRARREGAKIRHVRRRLELAQVCNKGCQKGLWGCLYPGMKMMSVALVHIFSYSKNKCTLVQQPSFSCLGIGSPAVSG